MVAKKPALLSCLLFFAWVSAGVPEDSATVKYRAMLEKLKNGDASVDLAELRLAYAQSSDYSPPGDSDAQKEVLAALSKKKYSKVIDLAEKALGEDYLDIDLHHALYIAYRETNQPAKADFHHAVAGGFISSIMKSGDGKTRETAYEVLSTHEEYVILKVFGLFLEKQSLLEEGGHRYDVMETRNPETNEKRTIYFNVDKPYGYLARILGGREK